MTSYDAWKLWSPWDDEPDEDPDACPVCGSYDVDAIAAPERMPRWVAIDCECNECSELFTLKYRRIK